MAYCEYYKCTNKDICEKSNLCITHCNIPDHNHCVAKSCDAIINICFHSKCEKHCKKKYIFRIN